MTPEVLADATAWLDEHLAAAGIARTGAVELMKVRPWATVLRAETSTGLVWMKAAAASTRFEVPLYELLARVVPEHVLHPIATDVERAWVLLPDGGSPFAARFEGDELAAPFCAALTQYAELQLDVAAHAQELVVLGVPDMRPERMPERFEEALALAAGSD